MDPAVPTPALGRPFPGALMHVALSLGSGGWGAGHVLALVIVGVAGVAAGMINAVVGSGSLFTFPTLLALGVPPITANVSNNIGLVPGNVAAVWGYRRELSGQRRRTSRLIPASLVGSLAGALALLKLPAGAFADIVPVLVAIAVVLVFVQPRLQAAMRRRAAAASPAALGSAATPAAPATPPAPATSGAQAAPAPGPRRSVAAVVERASPLLIGGVFLAGVYGGYFGAAQGVLLIGLLGSLVVETLQRLNAVKNVLALVVNAVAAVTFLIVAPARIEWTVVLVIAAGSTVGGLLGARVGRRLPATALRVVIAVVGVAAIIKLLA